EARAALTQGLAAVTSAEDRVRIALRMVLAELTGGDAQVGIAALRRLAADDPHDPRPRALLLEIPSVLQDAQAAQQLVGEMHKIEGATGVLWRLYQARAWLAGPAWRARRKECEDLLKACISADPRWVTPVQELGSLYERLRDWAAAEAVYATGFRLTGAPALLDPLLRILSDQRRFAEARALLEREAQRIDERTLSELQLALDLGSERFDAAQSVLELRLSGARQDPLDLVRLASVTYRAKRDAARGLQLLDEAARLGATPLAVARVRSQILLAEHRAAQQAGDTAAAETRAAEGAAALDALVAAHPTPDSYFLRAQFYTSLGQTERAEQDYVELARVAEDASGVAALGEFQAQTGRLDLAIETWETGLQRFPDSALLKRGLAKARLTRGAAGDRERAAQLVADVAPAETDDPDLLWVRAVERLQSNSPAGPREAREIVRTAARGTGAARAETYRGLVSLAMQLNERDAARDLVLRGLQQNPGDTGLTLLRGRIDLVTGAFDAARQTAADVLAREPGNVVALELGLAVAAAQRDVAALKRGLQSVDDLLAKQADDVGLKLVRARTLQALERPAEALQALAGLPDEASKEAAVPVALLRAELYRAQTDLAAAERELAEAAAAAPSDADVVHARFVLLAEQKRYGEIVALLPENSEPGKNARLLASAAVLLSGSAGHVELALGLAQRAVALADDDTSHLVLGDLLIAKGDRAGAERAYRAVLERGCCMSRGERWTKPCATRARRWLACQKTRTSATRWRRSCASSASSRTRATSTPAVPSWPSAVRRFAAGRCTSWLASVMT
ncbi:MAG: hypothetical protein AB1716_20585, partial [Planctomycetota bacterium]